uniref:Uncharacterized protein n=1 Tax=Anguilla anguilla TaxID=7936 RepID=A0A0E9Q503_ANGAN
MSLVRHEIGNLHSDKKYPINCRLNGFLRPRRNVLQYTTYFSSLGLIQGTRPSYY